MNFFKSVFADEPDPSNPESASPRSQDPDPTPQPDPNPSATGGWNFGDLIKTIATKSETVIETYRRDLQEFGSGLKKEIEVAQGSLETVGTKIDELGNTVLQGTAQIISHGILAADHESDSSDSNPPGQITSQRSLNSQRYSRFESQLRAIQGDVSTYVEEAEEAEEYGRWKVGFVLEEKREEIEAVMEENAVVESIYRRVAPAVVDDETFWSRYYFKVYKLKQAEDVRANLVKRAISVEEDEELSWDVDDDEYDESVGNVVAKSSLGRSGGQVADEKQKVVEEDNVAAVGEVVKEKSPVEEPQGAASEIDDHKKERVVESLDKEVNLVQDSGVLLKSDEENKEVDFGKKDLPSISDEEIKENVERESGNKDLLSKSDNKAGLEVKSEAPASSKESGVSASSVRPSAESEEEDLGWDEIEDLSSIDEKKANAGTSGGVANRAELQKRLSTAEEDEDLSWDIDDDEEPTKA